MTSRKVFYYQAYFGEVPLYAGLKTPRVLLWQDGTWVRGTRARPKNRKALIPTYLHEPSKFAWHLRKAIRALPGNTRAGGHFLVWVSSVSHKGGVLWGLVFDERQSKPRPKPLQGFTWVFQEHRLQVSSTEAIIAPGFSKRFFDLVQPLGVNP